MAISTPQIGTLTFSKTNKGLERLEPEWPTYIEVSDELLENADPAYLRRIDARQIEFSVFDGWAVYIPATATFVSLHHHTTVYKLVRYGK